MKIQCLILITLLYCSCKLSYDKAYVYSKGFVRNSYKFEHTGWYRKTSIVEILNFKETGSFYKSGRRFYLTGSRIIDTLFVYEFEPNKYKDSSYYIDLSNIALSRNNNVSVKLSQDSLTYKLNGLPLESYITQNKNSICKLLDSLVKLEVSDKKGIHLVDYIRLEKNSILKFSKIDENEWVDDYFKLSLSGKKIFVYDRFIGSSKYFQERFRRRKQVYRQ